MTSRAERCAHSDAVTACAHSALLMTSRAERPASPRRPCAVAAANTGVTCGQHAPERSLKDSMCRNVFTLHPCKDLAFQEYGGRNRTMCLSPFRRGYKSVALSSLGIRVQCADPSAKLVTVTNSNRNNFIPSTALRKWENKRTSWSPSGMPVAIWWIFGEIFWEPVNNQIPLEGEWSDVCVFSEDTCLLFKPFLRQKEQKEKEEEYLCI